MTSSRSKKGQLAFVVALAVSVTALTGISFPATAATPKATLTLANTAALPSFDTVEADSGLLIQYFQPVFDSLLRVDSTGKVLPFLATSWTYSKDMMTLKLQLHKGIKFTDGSAFNAKAAVLNLQHQLAGKSVLAGNVAAISAVKASGDSEVVISLKQQDPGLLEALATGVGMMASPKSLAGTSLKTQPVGTGPYVYDAQTSVTGDTYAYKANKNYWDKSLQSFAGIKIKTITDMVPALNAVQSGQVDGAPIDQSQVASAKSAGLTVQAKMDDWVGLQLIDREGKVSKAVGNVKVRQAINYALDRELLTAAFRKNGTGQPTTQLYAPTGKAYVKSLDSAYPYNVAKAKALMAEAGFASGVEIEMPDLGGHFGPDLYAAVVQELEAIGIKVKLDGSLPIPEMIGKIQSNGYAAIIAGGPLGTDWYDTNGYYGTGLWNGFGSSDATTKSLIAKIRSSQGATQTKALQDLNKYVVAQAWMAPIFRDASVYATDGKVTVKTQFGSIVPYIWSYKPKK